MTVFDVDLDLQERKLIRDLDATFQRELSNKRLEEQQKQTKAQNKKW